MAGSYSWHEKLAENLDCNTYFAKPYHSWERGLNENHNGLLRQFFPKRMALDNVSEKEAFRATDLMNNCQVSPRYSLLSKTTLRNISGFLINKSGFKLYQYSKAS
ncbi:Mobile element protein [uncultured Gammaproteobacteria bacterium]|nr:Mobile element protein [uncultured Gammaproteobacteria bacterium]